MRLPTYAELRRFVEVEGWTAVDGARPGWVGDHLRYAFTTPDGERLYTRISHGRGQIGDPDLFAHILRSQLKVEAGAFWEAVDDGVAPKRPTTSRGEQSPALDAKLARNLLRKVGLAPSDLAGLSRADAVRIWQEWLTRSGEA